MNYWKSLYRNVGVICVFLLYLPCVYAESKDHRKLMLENIFNDPAKISNRFYNPDRVIATINCTDCDNIPKVPLAGEFLKDGKEEYQIMHNGMRIRKGCYYGGETSWMDDIIYGLRGHHEPQEEKVFYEILKYIPSNATMIEIGSYWAYYSLWFAHEVKNARNYMIDISDPLLAVGKDNFRINGKTGHFHLGHIGNYPINTSSQVFIDAYLESNNIDHANIIHSDIQGAELEMLRSCENSIRKNMIDFFVISTHPTEKSDDDLHNACLAFLVERDFHIIAEHTPSQSCSADGLIVASRKGIQGPEKVQISKYGKVH